MRLPQRSMQPGRMAYPTPSVPPHSLWPIQRPRGLAPIFKSLLVFFAQPPAQCSPLIRHAPAETEPEDCRCGPFQYCPIHHGYIPSLYIALHFLLSTYLCRYVLYEISTYAPYYFRTFHEKYFPTSQCLSLSCRAWLVYRGFPQPSVTSKVRR